MRNSPCASAATSTSPARRSPATVRERRLDSGSRSTSSTSPARAQQTRWIQNAVIAAAGQLDHGRRDERTDQVAEAEGAAERRQRAGPVGDRHEARHEGVPGEGEHRGREPDQEDADAEHPRLRGEQRRSARPTIESADAPIIAVRSPMRATRAPVGMSPTSSPDQDHRRDEPGAREPRAEVVGDRRDDRDDRALADREQEGGQEHRDDDRPPGEGLLRRCSWRRSHVTAAGSA